MSDSADLSVVVEDEVNAADVKDGSSSPVRSRSRSPQNGRNRQKIYDYEGTNTTSDKPHLMRARLFVGNAQRMMRSDLKRIFSPHGDVLGVSIHKGYAFVQMDRERNANRAINCEDNAVHMGGRIRKCDCSSLISCFSHPISYLLLFSCHLVLPFCDFFL